VQSLTFDLARDPVGFATTITLVIMPLTYALQAHWSLQQKADNYKADIDEILLMQQRNSNSGALQWLLDTAAEQEHKEMFLAYNFLWRGSSVPPTMAKGDALRDVDAAIESFLMKYIKRNESLANLKVARGQEVRSCVAKPCSIKYCVFLECSAYRMCDCGMSIHA
jgi:hypothetical protein